jgi:hypothetical protein
MLSSASSSLETKMVKGPTSQKNKGVKGPKYKKVKKAPHTK